MRVHRYFAAVVAGLLHGAIPAAPAPAISEAEQLRIVQVMSGSLRERIDRLPVLLPAKHPLGQVEEQTVTLNRHAVVVEGQRFDALVIVAPAERASFAWTFLSPANLASWYVLREKGDVKGFANYLRRPRSQFPGAAKLKPEAGTELNFQKLDSASLAPNERYVLWFRFKDDVPVELTLRAGFFAKSALNNNALPALLLPAPTP